MFTQVALTSHARRVLRDGRHSRPTLRAPDCACVERFWFKGHWNVAGGVEARLIDFPQSVVELKSESDWNDRP